MSPDLLVALWCTWPPSDAPAFRREKPNPRAAALLGAVPRVGLFPVQGGDAPPAVRFLLVAVLPARNRASPAQSLLSFGRVSLS